MGGFWQVSWLAAMSGLERALMALHLFETGRQTVLSSLAPTLFDHQRRREPGRCFHGDALARAAFAESQQ